jgi:hypothetical protein
MLPTRTRTTIFCKKNANFNAEFTLEEILQILPPRIIKDSKIHNLVFKKNIENATGVLWYRFKYTDLYHISDTDIYKGAADLLVWCIEQGHIIVKEIDNDKPHSFHAEYKIESQEGKDQAK